MNPETNCVWLLGINIPAFLLKKISFSLVEASKNISIFLRIQFNLNFLFFFPLSCKG